jgi:hypothetical protein
VSAALAETREPLAVSSEQGIAGTVAADQKIPEGQAAQAVKT